MPIELTKREILQAVKIALLIEKTTADLKKDVARYLAWTSKESDDVFWRRGLVRAVFAYIEGLTYQLKRESHLARTLPRRDKFSAAELLLLVDRDYRLNDNGENKWGRLKSRLRPICNLRFACTLKRCRSITPCRNIRMAGKSSKQPLAFGIV
jgi:hypothetical protein